MPRVMMIRGVPSAGAYRAPIGRVLNGVGWLPQQRTPTIRQDMHAPRPVLGWLPEQRVQTIRQDEHAPRPVLGWLPRESVPTMRQDMHAPRPVLRGLRGMCDDDGWQVANALMTGVGSGFTTGSRQTVDGEVQTDAGLAAAGSGLQATASAWRELCAAQNQQAGDPTAYESAARMAEIQRLRMQMEGDAYRQQAAAAQQQASQQQKTMQYIGFGVAGVAALGALYFMFRK